MEFKELACILSNDLSKGIGTGFFVSSDGILVTCKHVLKDGEYELSVGQHVNIHRMDTGKRGIATIISIPTEPDVVLLKADPTDMYYRFMLEPLDSSTVFCPGYPSDFQYVVASAQLTHWDKKSVQLDNANSIGPGFSGAPILCDGRVVGMVKTISKQRDARYTELAFGVSSDLLARIMLKLGSDAGDSTNQIPVDVSIGNEGIYLSQVIDSNVKAVQRDIISYSDATWMDLYSFPYFKNGKRHIDAIIREGTRLLIVSNSGLGKSQLMQGLAWIYANTAYSESKEKNSERFVELSELFGIEEARIPVIIRGKDLDGLNSRKSLIKCAVLGVDSGDPVPLMFKNTIEEAIESGRAIILIDSFDEIRLEADKTTFIKQLSDFLGDHSYIPVIITSRRVGGLSDICNLGFTEISLLEFGEEQIVEQINRRVPDGEMAKKAADAIKANEYLFEMAKSPIMLASITRSVIETGKLRTVQEYLRDLTETIIKQRWADLDLIPSTSVQSILGGLAWRLIKNNESAFPQQDIRRILGEITSELNALRDPVRWSVTAPKNKSSKINKLFDVLSVRSGILTLDDSGNVLIFQDHLIESYLASLHVKALLALWTNKKDTSEYVIMDVFHRELKDTRINSQVMNTLVLSFPLLPHHLQKALLKYIVVRGVTSVDTDEICVIKKGIDNLINDTLGPNNVVNTSNFQSSTDREYVSRWLKSVSV